MLPEVVPGAGAPFKPVSQVSHFVAPEAELYVLPSQAVHVEPDVIYPALQTQSPLFPATRFLAGSQPHAVPANAQ